MTKREVKLGLATYTDPSGQRRIGQAGETVNVHDDDLERFDRLNGGGDEPVPVPKKRGRPRKA